MANQSEAFGIRVSRECWTALASLQSQRGDIPRNRLINEVLARGLETYPELKPDKVKASVG
ncbi:MAG: hypothetical protein ACTS2F_27570 [Thainema sp.]